MGAPRKMKPIVVDGVPRPDLDFREVPISVMALYMGIERTTLYRKVERGEIRHGMTLRNGYRYFKPREVLELCKTTTSICP